MVRQTMLRRFKGQSLKNGAIPVRARSGMETGEEVALIHTEARSWRAPHRGGTQVLAAIFLAVRLCRSAPAQMAQTAQREKS